MIVQDRYSSTTRESHITRGVLIQNHRRDPLKFQGELDRLGPADGVRLQEVSHKSLNDRGLNILTKGSNASREEGGCATSRRRQALVRRRTQQPCDRHADV